MINDPTITASCDGCGDEEEMELTPLAGGSWDDRNVKRTLEKRGWVFDGDKCYCEDCAKRRKRG